MDEPSPQAYHDIGSRVTVMAPLAACDLYNRRESFDIYGHIRSAILVISYMTSVL